jgi:methionine sulfoxide reductase heme-binding subunit
VTAPVLVSAATRDSLTDARRKRSKPLPQRIGKPIAFIASLAPAVWLAYATLTDRLQGDVVKIIEIDTGTWALRFLAITLLVTPLKQITGWAWLASFRRMFGLFAFFYATVHLNIYALLDLELQFGELWKGVVKRPYITVGMLSWLLLVPLAITSPNAIAKKLGGVRWKQLHRLTYLVGVTATLHYLWAVKKDTFWPLVYFALFAGLLGWRVWQARRRRAV